MKHVGIVGLIALCALPARGAEDQLTPTVKHALTPIDANPTKEELVRIFPQDAVIQLAQIARDPSVDFGVRLRAIRSLPHFCPVTSCVNSLPHDTVVALIAGVAPGDHSGPTILLLRAAIETLGVTRSGDPNDVTRLVPFLDNASRDIRAATARALRDLCDPQAMPALRTRQLVETVPQVNEALDDAVRDLGQCSP